MELYIKLEDLHVFYAINLYDGKAWMLYTLVDKLPGFKKVLFYQNLVDTHNKIYQYQITKLT